MLSFIILIIISYARTCVCNSHTDIFIKQKKIENNYVFRRYKSRLFEAKIDVKLVMKINGHVCTCSNVIQHQETLFRPQSFLSSINFACTSTLIISEFNLIV